MLLIGAKLHYDHCQQHKPNWCIGSKDLRDWVYCSFDTIGKLIVLQSGEGPRLPIEGQLISRKEGLDPLVGTLYKDGTIIDKGGKLIGDVTFTGQVVTTDGKPFIETYGNLSIRNEAGQWVGVINQRGI